MPALPFKKDFRPFSNLKMGNMCDFKGNEKSDEIIVICCFFPDGLTCFLWTLQMIPKYIKAKTSHVFALLANGIHPKTWY